MTHDPATAERAHTVLADDKAPPSPFAADDASDEPWSEARLEADLLMGVRWPFFRDKSLDHLDGHHDQEDLGDDNG